MRVTQTVTGTEARVRDRVGTVTDRVRERQ